MIVYCLFRSIVRNRVPVAVIVRNVIMPNSTMTDEPLVVILKQTTSDESDDEESTD